jgi:hypothetical protein
MKKFLSRILMGALKTFAAFVLLSIVARFVPTLNWFFFQKNEHDRVFYTLLEAEKAMAQGKTYDVLIFGSSTCENAIDPELFTELTGLSVFKLVTGAQTINMSVELARYCAPRMQPRYVIVDAYPRYGRELTEEGIERAIINSPNATSPLIMSILSIDPYSVTTDYLWLSRAIGTWVKPYNESSIMKRPHEFEMLGPGFTRTVVDPPAPAQGFNVSPLAAEGVMSLNALGDDLARTNQQLVAIVPPLQNGVITFEAEATFPLIQPEARPDTCFFDQKHLRGVCVKGYTEEVAARFNAFRASEPAKGNLHAGEKQR